MTSWELFPHLTEDEQARILLDKAEESWKLQADFQVQKETVEKYLGIARKVLEGELEKLSELICFLDDPEMAEDFTTIYEQVRGSEKTEAALDLASYACGFICNISAERAGRNQLPDPVLESVPEIYEYFRARAELLKLGD